MDADTTEKWVQCVKCQKWRVVPNTLKLSPGWECRHNVFSAEYNRCSAPQEEMPSADEAPAKPPASITDEIFARYSLVEPSKDSLFSKSTCSCTLCQEINAAAASWDNKKMTHSVPLIACLLKSISNTAHIAQEIEDDKAFLYK